MTTSEFYTLSNGIELTGNEWWEMQREYNHSPLSTEEFVKEWCERHHDKVYKANRMKELNRQLGVLNDLKWSLPSVFNWEMRRPSRKYLRKKIREELAKNRILLQVKSYRSDLPEINIRYIHEQIDDKRAAIASRMRGLREQM